MDLDEVDRKLVQELQRDGRMSLSLLASRVGMSRTAVRTRVQRLLRDRVVRPVAVVHPSVFGLNALGHVSVELSGAARAVAERIATFEDVPFVSIVGGRFGVIAEIRSPNDFAFAETVRAIRGLDGVRRVETVRYAQVVKDPYMPPREFRQLQLDEVDRQLLALLQQDGRAPFAQLGRRVGLSAGAARARVLRFLSHGIVHVAGLANPTTLGVGQMSGFAIWGDRLLEDDIPTIAQLPEVSYLARCVGRCDVIGTAIAASSAQLIDFFDVLRSLASVRWLETWTHLELVKEEYERSPLNPPDT